MQVDVLNIGGIETTFISQSTNRSYTRATFFLHGRLQDRYHFEKEHLDFIKQLLSLGHLVIMIDHRNHGKRLVNEQQNNGLKTNPNHPVDMYALQYGTAQDISFLIDCIPLHGYKIIEYSIIGYSLGGHTAHFCATDSRISRIVSVVGCGDYETLMAKRSIQLNADLKDVVYKLDPFYKVHSIRHAKMLFLYGAKDELVPKACNQRFIETLKNEGINFEEFVDEDVGHAFSDKMKQFIIDWFSSD